MEFYFNGLVSVFELIKKNLNENMFFLPNVTTPTCLFSKFHKNEKSLQPSVHIHMFQSKNFWGSLLSSAA